MARRRAGLGRGLEALIPTVQSAEAEEAIQLLEIEDDYIRQHLQRGAELSPYEVRRFTNAIHILTQLFVETLTGLFVENLTNTDAARRVKGKHAAADQASERLHEMEAALGISFDGMDEDEVVKVLAFLLNSDD